MKGRAVTIMHKKRTAVTKESDLLVKRIVKNILLYIILVFFSNLILFYVQEYFKIYYLVFYVVFFCANMIVGLLLGLYCSKLSMQIIVSVVLFASVIFWMVSISPFNMIYQIIIFVIMSANIFGASVAIKMNSVRGQKDTNRKSMGSD